MTTKPAYSAGVTGTDLKRARNAAGLSQIALARRAGIGRHAVSYWECKPRLDPRGWAVLRMIEVLGRENLPYFSTVNARARAWGITGPDAFAARLLADERARRLVRDTRQATRRRVRCGAKTRKGTPCRNMSEPAMRRCRFHGGMSTGPKTLEGRERVAEAQRLRWQAWRVARDEI